jgi:Family of unknown function (DUF6504)
VVRRFEEPIEVRSRDDEQTATGTPDAFVWRGRLYVVREVLDHWQERRPWWREALDPVMVSGSADSAGGGDGAYRTDRAGRVRAESLDDGGSDPSFLGSARERQVWRVEASPGRMASVGVYDLGADFYPMQWRLLRVAD